MTIFDAPDFANSVVTGALVYGPPKSRRARLLNRIRRLLGRDEQDEVFAYLTPDNAGDLTIGWSAGGTFELYGPFPDMRK